MDIYYFIIPILLHFLSFWISCIALYRFDKNAINENIITIEKYYNTCKNSLINQLSITVPLHYLLHTYIKNSIEQSESDTIIVIVFKIFIISHIANFLFYGIHRLLHLQQIYKFIHKYHHLHTTPISPSSLDAHPIEHLLLNNLSFLLPFILFGTNYVVFILLIIFASIEPALSHTYIESNYKNNDHIIHHKYFKYNYGFYEYLDKLLNTYYIPKTS